LSTLVLLKKTVRQNLDFLILRWSRGNTVKTGKATSKLFCLQLFANMWVMNDDDDNDDDGSNDYVSN
jgi:hypothetical protein